MAQCRTAVHEPTLFLEGDPPLSKTPTATLITQRRLGTVGALVLALGTMLPTEKPDPTTQSSDPPSSQKNTLSIPQHVEGSAVPQESTVEEFLVHHKTFTCRFGKREINGSLDEQGNISAVHFDDLTITLTSPVSPQTLERFLRSVTGTAALLQTQALSAHEGKIEAIGGARFLFTTGAGKAQQMLATNRDILTIDRADEARRTQAEAEWKETMRSLTPLSQAQKDAIGARIKIHNGRMRLVYDDLTGRMQHTNWHYWYQRRNEFANGWNAISVEWKNASIDAQGILLSQFHNHLDSWERELSTKPEMESEEAFQKRYEALFQELQQLRKLESPLRIRAHTRHLRDAARDLTIAEQSSHLSQKNFTREEQSSTGLLLRHQTYEDDVLTKETEYDPSGNTTKETFSRYFPGGQLRRTQEHTPKDDKLTLQRQTDYWRNGNTHAVLDKRSDAFAYFGESGSLLYEDVARSNREKRQRGMVDAKGERFGLYRDEKAKNPHLTAGQYLDMLAKKIDTEERLAVFFEQFLWYALDNGDSWQTAEETVQRMEEYEKGGAHYMRGDCDDYAFLAREILQRQGKNAHVVYIPGHAICVWVETDTEGEYHARAQDTLGFDHNGNVYGPSIPRDRKKAEGYTQLIDALNSLMVKYKEGWAAKGYLFDKNAVRIMPNPPSGNYRIVTADYFLQKVS